MTAREKFKKDDRVKQVAGPTIHGQFSVGTVTGFGRRSDIVRVRRDGIKETVSYLMDFWERESDA